MKFDEIVKSLLEIAKLIYKFLESVSFFISLKFYIFSQSWYY